MEDTWFRGTNLAIHFWVLHIICNGQNVAYNEVWADGVVKVLNSLLGCFNQKITEPTWEGGGGLVAIIQDLVLSDRPDQMVLKLNTSQFYSSQ
jgi:hypothetical protein